MNPRSNNQIGVCSWSLQATSIESLLGSLQSLGLSCVHLALDPLRITPDAWAETGEKLREAGVTIGAGMIGCVGEDYSTLDTIHRTGGVVPDEHWETNFANAQAAAQQADGLDIPQVSFHAGFIPPDLDSPSCGKLMDRVGQIADVFAAKGIALLLESGQEDAPTLDAFLQRLGKDNVGVNFDPANILLYDKGDPIEALRRLLPHVRQVHIKDAIRTATPGQWGAEVPVGEGQVDWEAFVSVLRERHFSGNLMIEREAGARRHADILAAVRLLQGLLG